MLPIFLQIFAHPWRLLPTDPRVVQILQTYPHPNIRIMQADIRSTNTEWFDFKEESFSLTPGFPEYKFCYMKEPSIQPICPSSPQIDNITPGIYYVALMGACSRGTVWVNRHVVHVNILEDPTGAPISSPSSSPVDTPTSVPTNTPTYANMVPPVWYFLMEESLVEDIDIEFGTNVNTYDFTTAEWMPTGTLATDDLGDTIVWQDGKSGRPQHHATPAPGFGTHNAKNILLTGGWVGDTQLIGTGTSGLGSFDVTYTIQDNSGNPETLTRTVNIVVPISPPAPSTATPTPAPSPPPAPSPQPAPSVTTPPPAPSVTILPPSYDAPINSPSSSPVDTSSRSPSHVPTDAPINSPSDSPSSSPSHVPTNAPINSPSRSPSSSPVDAPSRFPSHVPTGAPINSPSSSSSSSPSHVPTDAPINSPGSPVDTPSNFPTISPSFVPSNSECSNTADFILIGAGAGGSASAAMLRRLGANFLWYEGGKNQNNILTDHPKAAYSRFSVPSWDSTLLPELRAGGKQLPYSIPKVAGGMTHHYEGVNYWNMEDTITSTDMSVDEEQNVLQFVRNTTLRHVQCDVSDTRYHTHYRTASDPAPHTDQPFMSLNACFYGHCVNDTNCNLNNYFGGKAGEWYSGSASTEYGTDSLHTDYVATQLIVKGKRVTGVKLRDGSNQLLTACANRAVLLAGGVMGDARLLLPHISEYKFFGQPYLFHYSNPTTCDPGTYSGGTFFKTPKSSNETGFMSILGICTEKGKSQIKYMAPQAINPSMSGRIYYSSSGKIIAQTNYDDNILDTLRQDVADAARFLFNITQLESFLVDTWTGGGYHWTGQKDLSLRSRVNNFDNLYLADALGVTGTTSGWTSWNARVQGALAAYRAVHNNTDGCNFTKSSYRSLSCCDTRTSTTCTLMRAQYKMDGCCK